MRLIARIERTKSAYSRRNLHAKRKKIGSCARRFESFGDLKDERDGNKKAALLRERL
jgi:hypothetical protein